MPGLSSANQPAPSTPESFADQSARYRFVTSLIEVLGGSLNAALRS